MEGIPDLDKELASDLWRIAEELKRRQALLGIDGLHNQVHGLLAEAIQKLEAARDVLISQE